MANHAFRRFAGGRAPHPITDEGCALLSVHGEVDRVIVDKDTLEQGMAHSRFLHWGSWPG
jgi:hypothetical protein